MYQVIVLMKVEARLYLLDKPVLCLYPIPWFALLYLKGGSRYHVWQCMLLL